jgi:hypothetical protein
LSDVILKIIVFQARFSRAETCLVSIKKPEKKCSFLNFNSWKINYFKCLSNEIPYLEKKSRFFKKHEFFSRFSLKVWSKTKLIPILVKRGVDFEHFDPKFDQKPSKNLPCQINFLPFQKHVFFTENREKHRSFYGFSKTSPSNSLSKHSIFCSKTPKSIKWSPKPQSHTFLSLFDIPIPNRQFSKNAWNLKYVQLIRFYKNKPLKTKMSYIFTFIFNPKNHPVYYPTFSQKPKLQSVLFIYFLILKTAGYWLLLPLKSTPKTHHKVFNFSPIKTPYFLVSFFTIKP